MPFRNQQSIPNEQTSALDTLLEAERMVAARLAQARKEADQLVAEAEAAAAELTNRAWADLQEELHILDLQQKARLAGMEQEIEQASRSLVTRYRTMPQADIDSIARGLLEGLVRLPEPEST